MPAAWAEPLGPKSGSLAALTVPLLIADALTAPLRVVALSVPTLIVPAEKPVGENVYDVPCSCHCAVLDCG